MGSRIACSIGVSFTRITSMFSNISRSTLSLILSQRKISSRLEEFQTFLYLVRPFPRLESAPISPFLSTSKLGFPPNSEAASPFTSCGGLSESLPLSVLSKFSTGVLKWGTWGALPLSIFLPSFTLSHGLN